jgi:hypothetical protein
MLPIEPLARVADALATLTVSLRDAQQWEKDQSIRFDAAELLCGLEGLIALIEISDPGRRRSLGMEAVHYTQPSTEREDELVSRVAIGWFGARLVARIRTLAFRVGIAAPSGLEAIERELLGGQSKARDELYEFVARSYSSP